MVTRPLSGSCFSTGGGPSYPGFSLAASALVYSFTAAPVVLPACSHGPSGSISARAFSTRGSTLSTKTSAIGASSACDSLRVTVPLPHMASNAGTAYRHTSYRACARSACFASTPSNSHGLAAAVHRTRPV